MNSAVILAIFFVAFLVTTVFFNKYRGKNIYLSILSGLIVGQITLIIASASGIPIHGESGSLSTELIFWALHLIIPAIIYLSFLYIVYTTNLFKSRSKFSS